MTSFGKAFVAIWHDLAAGSERDFEAWHTIEHMPERVGVPGFLRGRRYMNWQQPAHVCFTLYEAAHIETFRSPGYLARLNDPTPWTGRNQPNMTNFLRGACETVMSLGDGVGGAVATLRIAPGLGDAEEVRRRLLTLAPEIATLHGITAVHIGRHRPEIAGAPTSESALRPNPSDRWFDYVVLVEAIGARQLVEARDRMASLIGDLWPEDADFGVYPLEFMIRSPG